MFRPKKHCVPRLSTISMPDLLAPLCRCSLTPALPNCLVLSASTSAVAIRCLSPLRLSRLKVIGALPETGILPFVVLCFYNLVNMACVWTPFLMGLPRKNLIANRSSESSLACRRTANLIGSILLVVECFPSIRSIGMMTLRNVVFLRIHPILVFRTCKCTTEPGIRTSTFLP